MPGYTETFLVTALPDSVQGTKLRLAVLVSPRLGADTTEPQPLSNWPDALNWPSIAPTWQVTLVQGPTNVTVQAQEVSNGYDGQTWTAIFPPGMATTPYQPPLLPEGAENENLLPPVATFPVAAVRDAVKDLHVHLLDSADLRTRFPLLHELQNLDVFKPIIGALGQDVLSKVQATQSSGGVVDPLPANAFALLDLFHGARPGSDQPAPVVTGVSPAAGPPRGGTPVTITGTGFLPNVTQVVFHDPKGKPPDRPAGDVVVVNPTTITCTSPPGLLQDTADVLVSTTGGTSLTSPAARFTYLVPPTVTGVSPDHGPVAGGNQVTITGSDFIAGNGPDGEPVTKVVFGTVAATAVSVGTGGASLLCKVPPAAEDALEVDVVVTTAGGSSTPSAASRYTYVPLPAVTAVSPAKGPVAGNQAVTITGTHLTGAVTLHFGAAAIPAHAGTDTTLTATTPLATKAGPVHVTVTTEDGGTSETTDADEYTYLALPTVTGVSPDHGPIAGGTSVTVTGTNLATAAGVSFGSAAQVTPTSVTDTSLKAVSPQVTAAGPVDVVVHTADAGDSTASGADTFTYTEN